MRKFENGDRVAFYTGSERKETIRKGVIKGTGYADDDLAGAIWIVEPDQSSAVNNGWDCISIPERVIWKIKDIMKEKE